MYIETENLIIRNHIESDWKDLYDYLSLPEVYKFEPGNPVTREESRTMIAERCKGSDFLAVVRKNTGPMIGHLYFHHAEPKHFMTWELGYIFNPDYQRRGYCTEASSAIVHYAFKEWNAHKIVAFCNPENIASWKVLEKIGMEREGFFKQKAFFRRDSGGNPLWHDAYAYGILNRGISLR
jgi:ribosomal-protein-alanine N-acetyltransferase